MTQKKESSLSQHRQLEAAVYLSKNVVAFIVSSVCLGCKSRDNERYDKLYALEFYMDSPDMLGGGLMYAICAVWVCEHQ